MASPRLCSQTRLHHRVRTATTKAATQPRHNAVAHVHWSPRLKPAPTRKPIIEPRIICDFIESFTFAKQNFCHRPKVEALNRKTQCLSSIFLWKEEGWLRPEKITRNFLPGAQEAYRTICTQHEVP